MKISRPLLTLVCAATVLAGCSTPSAPQSTQSERSVIADAGQSSQSDTSTVLNVAASFYPLQYLVEQIGGDRVAVSSLTPPGAEPHDLELSPAKVNELGRSDIVVYLSGFQTAVDDAVAINPPEHVVDVASAVQLLSPTHANEDTQSGHNEAEDTDSTDEEHGDHDTGHEHDHGDVDPHFWLDPQRMAQAATMIGQALAKADPTNAQLYTTQAAQVSTSLNELSTEIVEGTRKCAHTTFITSHEAFGYLADRASVNQEGIAGIDPEASPSPAKLKEISELAKKEGVTTIFTETLIDPKIAQTLAEDLGIKTAVLDPLESQNDPSKDYMDVMRDNLAALRTALDCK